MVEGVQVPVIALVLVVGSAVGDDPIQIGAMALKTGRVSLFTITEVVHVIRLLHPSVTVQVMVEFPTLKLPLASVPVPVLVVAPVMA